jgi:hypothetical protein
MVGFPLESVACRAEHQLGLDYRGGGRGWSPRVVNHLLHITVAMLLLQLEERISGAGLPPATGPAQRSRIGPRV